MAAPFYRAIGRAMSRWQHVEAAMFLVAHAIMGTEFKYTSTVFFLINSADLKLRLVNGFCQLYFSEAEFDTLWKTIERQSNFATAWLTSSRISLPINHTWIQTSHQSCFPLIISI